MDKALTRAINMVLRVVLRRAVNWAVNRGFDAVGKPPEQSPSVARRGDAERMRRSLRQIGRWRP